MNFAESGFRYDSFHDFPLGKYFDSVRQIMVGTVVFGEEFAKQWDNYFRVDGEQLLHGEAIRSSQFQDNQMSARFQYTTHFGEAFVQVFKIADTECYGDSVKSIVGKGERSCLLYTSDAADE